MDKMFKSVVYHPWKAIFVCLIVVVISGFGLSRAVIVTDYEIFFDGENDRLQAHYDIEDRYGRQDVISVLVAHESEDTFNPEVLVAIEHLTDEFWKTPSTRRVDSLTNFPYVLGTEDALEVSDLFEAPFTAEEIATKKEYALNEPALVGTILAPDGRFSLIRISILLPEDDSTAGAPSLEFVKSMLDEFKSSNPEFEFYLTGSIVINDGFYRESTVGVARLIGFMLVATTILVGVFFKSVSVTLSSLVLVLCSAVMTMGLACWIGISITAQTSTAPIIVMALCLASAIHIISSRYYHIENNPSHTVGFDSVLYSLKSNLMPISLTTVTTTIGFLCLNLTDVPPLRFVGTTAAIGTLVNLFLCFCLLPALMSVSRVRRVAAIHNVDWCVFSTWLMDKRPLVLTVISFCFLASLFLIPRNTIDDNIITYFDEDEEIRIHTEFIEETTAPFSYAFLSLPSPFPGGVSDPEYLNHLNRLVDWLRDQPEVQTVTAFTDNMKTLNRAMNAGDDQFYAIPQDRVLSSQYLLLYELSLPFGVDLANTLDISKTSSRILIGYVDGQSGMMRSSVDKLDQWMEENLPVEMKTAAAGPSLLFAYIWHDAAVANLVSMGVAFFLISVVIGVALRSVKLGLVSLIPNFLPAIMAFGLWGLINGQIDIGSSIVAVISFGIIVDDTIHFLSKYRDARKNGSSAKIAVIYAFERVGRALFITTIILIVGFSIFTMSAMTLNSSMGLLTAIAIGLALLLDFFLLPLILFATDKDTSMEDDTNKEQSLGYQEATTI